MSLLDTATIIVTPNGYKEGKLYALKPTNGAGDLTVTRATTATRVNSAGLVELVPYNLYEYSEQFDNAYWTKAAVTISANATTAPNGTLTADKAIATATTTAHDVTRNLTRISGSYTATMSIYAKKSEDKYILLQLADGGGGIGITFDVDLGTVSTAAATYGTGWSAVSNSITSVGNGWFRITFTVTTTNASTSLNTSYRVGNIANLFGGSTGNGVNGVFIWGAQIVDGDQAKDYYPTETRLNIPRLDYSNGTCPSILVEPQRTNLALSSEDFTNASYWNNSNTTDTANQAISPDGTQDADRVNGDAVNTFHRIYRQASISASTAYTFSVYVKANTLGFIQLALNNGFTSNYLLSPYANFNLTTGVVSQSANGATAQIQSLTNGWYRCSITATSLAGATAGEYNINLINSGTLTAFQSWAGTTNDSVFLYGAQFEAGSTISSYIPTTTASVTRNADVITKTGLTGSSVITETFENGTTNTITNPTTYTMSQGRIKLVTRV